MKLIKISTKYRFLPFLNPEEEERTNLYVRDSSARAVAVDDKGDAICLRESTSLRPVPQLPSPPLSVIYKKGYDLVEQTSPTSCREILVSVVTRMSVKLFCTDHYRSDVRDMLRHEFYNEENKAILEKHMPAANKGKFRLAIRSSEALLPYWDKAIYNSLTVLSQMGLPVKTLDVVAVETGVKGVYAVVITLPKKVQQPIALNVYTLFLRFFFEIITCRFKSVRDLIDPDKESFGINRVFSLLPEIDKEVDRYIDNPTSILASIHLIRSLRDTSINVEGAEVNALLYILRKGACHIPLLSGSTNKTMVLFHKELGFSPSYRHFGNVFGQYLVSSDQEITFLYRIGINTLVSDIKRILEYDLVETEGLKVAYNVLKSIKHLL